MDYNYVRMRNAEKEGNTELAAQYRNLYESGKDIKETSHIIDYVLILLVIVAIALGIYAVCYKHSVNTASSLNVPSESTEETTVIPTEDAEHSEV